YYPGIYQMALGTTEWLNRKPLVGFWPRLCAAACGLALLVTGLVRLRGLAWDCRLLGLAGALWVGVVVAAVVHQGIVSICYALPAPRVPVIRVAFPLEKVGYRLPVEVETNPLDADNYDTFFVSLQRLGLVPRVYERLEEALEAEVVVLADRVA